MDLPGRYIEAVKLARRAALRALELSSLEEPTARTVESLGARRPVLVAFGKGACSMARGLLQAVREVEGGVVVVPEGVQCRLERVETLWSTHPVPSERSLEAARAVLEWLRPLGEGDEAAVLVSGGGSALVEMPIHPLTIEELAEANRVLLASGLSILEINTVRKHLSMVKGGRLAEAAYPARTIGVYASDVPGDRLDLIASGPTVPDPTTYRDALHIVRDAGLEGGLPPRVLETLEKGARGLVPETPKPGSGVFSRVENRLAIANIHVLTRLARDLRGWGLNTLVLTSRLEGESREAAKVLASLALESLHRGIPVTSPAAILVGGETSVTLPEGSGGRGGRNMELALAMAARIDYWSPDLPPGTIAVASIDTDGIDGSTPSAGAAVANGVTHIAGRERVARALRTHDTYPLLHELGATIDTGPTGSNLNSITIILVNPV